MGGYNVGSHAHMWHPRAMRGLRSIAAANTLIFAALLGHILAGGNHLTLQRGFILAVALTLIALFLIRATGDPLRMVIAIFIAQNLAHFIAGSSGESANAMVAAHLISAVISYQLLRYFDKTLPALNQVFMALILPVVFRSVPIAAKLITNPYFTYRPLVTRFLFPSYSLRAPPSI
jgi:hypothetical protein